MGSNDIPPPHVPTHVVPIYNLCLQIGGTLWTICYALMVHESFKTKSYGMPLFALALNFGWEVVYALYVAESPLERVIFDVWMVLDCGMVFGMMRFARYEWRDAPVVARNIVGVFVGMTVVAVAGHGTFAYWWIENEVGKREGKFYRGVVGADTTELGFWSAVVCQVYLSAASLCQLVVRQHSGGVSWGIWGTRVLGSVIGLYGAYAWEWYFWREAHEYFMSPFSVFLWMTSLLCDCLYPFVLWQVRKTERILEDGRKVSGDAVNRGVVAKLD